jgi:hypothetical protein
VDVYNYAGGDLARFVNCSFEADGSGKFNATTNSGYNGIIVWGGHADDPVTFGCPTGTTGADVSIYAGSESGLGTSQLPPAKQIVSCH